MDPASIAAAFVCGDIRRQPNGADTTFLAEKMMQIDADQQSAMAQMLAAASQESLPAGVGRNLDLGLKSRRSHFALRRKRVARPSFGHVIAICWNQTFPVPLTP